MSVIASRMHHLLTSSSVRYAVRSKVFALGPKDLFQRCRYFTHRTEDYVKLKATEFHVNPNFGVFRSVGNLDCIIKPTCPQEYPNADRAFVCIYGKESTSCHDINIELTGELRDVLTVNAFPESSFMYCEVQIPVKYDLDIHLLNEAGVQIHGMEANEVNVKTVLGNINTNGLHSHNIHFNTVTGNITAEGTLQGNLFINAKKTNIIAKKLQGMAMSIDAEELDTSIESSYMNQGEINAHHGNINLKNLHGCTDLVLRNGQISISGLHGQIAGFIGTGNVNVQVTEITSNSALHVNEGDMNISVLQDPRHALEVTAPSLEIASELKSKGVISASINQRQTFSLTINEASDSNTLIATVVKGRAKVKCQDWFSTLGIKSG